MGHLPVCLQKILTPGVALRMEGGGVVYRNCCGGAVVYRYCSAEKQDGKHFRAELQELA